VTLGIQITCPIALLALFDILEALGNDCIRNLTRSLQNFRYVSERWLANIHCSSVFAHFAAAAASDDAIENPSSLQIVSITSLISMSAAIVGTAVGKFDKLQYTTMQTA